MMKLHWSPRSPFVRKVMVAAHELGLADRIQTVRTVVAMQKPARELLPDNPLGKIPTLVLADGSVLYDSQVIIEYLDSLAGDGRLIPASGPARFTELRRHALANGFLDLLILWRNERDKPHPLPALLDAFALKADAVLRALEDEIGAIAAGPVGLAQITTAILGAYMDFRFPQLSWRAACPQLAAWESSFAARPSMRATAFEIDVALRHQQVNYVGALYMLNAVLPVVLRQKSGHKDTACLQFCVLGLVQVTRKPSCLNEAHVCDARVQCT
jgi:glutathione S-transferase